MKRCAIQNFSKLLAWRKTAALPHMLKLGLGLDLGQDVSPEESCIILLIIDIIIITIIPGTEL